MATAAERLKERLAKYAPQSPATNAPREVPKEPVLENTVDSVPTGSAGSPELRAALESLSRGASSEQKQSASAGLENLAEQGALNEPVRIERAPVSGEQLPSDQQHSESQPAEDRDTGTSTVAGGEVSQSVQPQQVPVQHEFVSSVVLSDQLQSTDVVVVERPVSDGPVPRELEATAASSTELDTSNPVHQNFLQRLADLESALLARDPLMKTHLGEIHKHMIQYEEIANLLRPDEIAKIMAAQQAHTGIVLRAETLGKSKTATSKKAAKLGVNDI